MTSRYDWNAIRAAYEGGATLDDITERFGVDISQASRTLRRMGVMMREKGRPTKARAELIVALSTAPSSRHEVASAFGVSVRTVSRVIASLRRAKASP